MDSTLISKSLLERLLDKRVLLNEEEYILNTEKESVESKLESLEVEAIRDQNEIKKNRIKKPRLKIIKK